EIRNAQGETEGLPLLIPGWCSTPTMIGGSIDGGAKIYGALTDPYPITDFRDGMASNKVEVSIFVPSGSSIVLSKTSDWAFVYNQYTIFWDLLGLGLPDFDKKRDSLNAAFMNAFYKSLIATGGKETFTTMVINLKNWPQMIASFVQSGLDAIEATGDEILINTVQEQLRKKGVSSLADKNGLIVLAETFVAGARLADQINDLRNNMLNPDYKGNHIVIQTPTSVDYSKNKQLVLNDILIAARFSYGAKYEDIFNKLGKPDYSGSYESYNTIMMIYDDLGVEYIVTEKYESENYVHPWDGLIGIGFWKPYNTQMGITIGTNISRVKEILSIPDSEHEDAETGLWLLTYNLDECYKLYLYFEDNNSNLQSVDLDYI
ncbi:MAG: hypothetical protein PHY90_12475, partial [Desulfitobacteriaceae bacterium]|nr:hypothetical protein [Desulfitobacteriaceae bacterium]